MTPLRAIGLAGLCVIGGCASPLLAPAADLSAMSVTVPASQVYSPGTREKRYKETKTGRVQVRRLTDAGSDGSWTMTSADASVIDSRPEAGVAIQVLTFVPLDGGGVGLRTVIDYGENAVTTYTPPLALMPKMLGREGWKTESNVRLTYADRPGVDRSSGKASLELKIIKAEGSGKALRVTISSLLKIGLSPAHVTEEEVRVVGAKGIESEHERRIVKVGFLTIESTEHQFEWQE